MHDDLAIIGFGEAGMAFVCPGARVYDRKTDDFETRAGKQSDYETAGVSGFATAAEALAGAGAALSLVTADQALQAALAGAPSLAAGALWLDMNSVAPGTKREAARAVEAAGGRYVDVAIMAPVHPGRLATPLLVSGTEADEAVARLRALGFTSVRAVGSRVGDASSIKMIRSVMVKGIEALTAECLLAADAAGVGEEVLASLDASDKAIPWAARADYNLERMLVHGVRRGAEMEEVVKTLDALGTGSAMSRAGADRQNALGSLGIVPPVGLEAKLATLRPAARGEAV
jgi:3-hydroxyisobutyrate dehydrogenase-like beta-hydroxyacid dehydrogenase